MKSFEESFSVWLKSKARALDSACGTAMEEGLVGLNGDDLVAANKSLSNLYADTSSGLAMPGGDCDYSLKGVGALYTGHWHGKRVHDSLSVLVPIRDLISAQRSNVIDVGAGTGAALWAWVLVACYAHEMGDALPVLTWTSIDGSADMIEQSDRLWTHLCRLLPSAKKVVIGQPPQCADWRNPPALPADAAVVGS